MASYNHIILQSSDAGATLSKWFRVVAQGYNDGALTKSQNIKQTIGGGIDGSVGAVYRMWNPIIRVRQEEVTPFDYGTRTELEEFYSYNDPGGTPSNIIGLVDHRGENHNVLIVGDFETQTLGCMIEGIDAWFFIQLQLQEIPA